MTTYQQQQDAYLEAQEQEMNRTTLEANKSNVQQSQVQQSMMYKDEERSMIKDQLDLSEELEMIEHLLRGDIYKENNLGRGSWNAPDNPDMVILSDYGIHLIMNTIKFYINKNTLLSNYDEETINRKMEDFACDLADTIFMEYEKVFQYPSANQVEQELKDRLRRKQQSLIATHELRNEEYDEEKIWWKLVHEIDPTKEREKIKEQIIKNKLKRYLILIRTVQDAVHSTYLRAWKGQERKTLREHIHVSETRGNMTPPPQQPTKMNPLNWIRG